ncbi:hypothetical protein U0070_012704 [Myodes glareolus]|uniref:Flavodoxin-like domain-containing protein n=1 Tax=Myodes glareolus TaxID=447135 RepID=A0AAW0JQA8_MYOGA
MGGVDIVCISLREVVLLLCVSVLSVLEPRLHNQVVRSQERSVPGAHDSSLSLQQKQTHVSGVKIFYGSQTGTAKGFAVTLAKAVTSLDLPVAIWLEEAANDFRFGKTYLKGLRYAVFGLGDSAYQSHFNKVGTNVDKWLWMLGAKRVLTRGEGDRNAVQSKHGSIEADFTAWKTKFISRLQALQSGEKMACSGDCKRGKCESSQPGSGEVRQHLQGDLHPRDAEEEEPCESSSEEELGSQDYQNVNSVVDVEDLGSIVSPMKKEKREKATQEEKAGVRRSSERNEDSEGRAMITPALREALTKQGDHLPGLGPYCSLVPRTGRIGQGCYGDKEKVSCWLVCQLGHSACN